MAYEQISLNMPLAISYPESADDVIKLWKMNVSEPEDDPDAFSYNAIKTGYSFFIYGKKCFELTDDGNGYVLKLPIRFVSALFPHEVQNSKKDLISTPSLSSEQMNQLFTLLKAQKHENFRSLISETFACCNSFVACSDVGHCIHEHDRFYNGCYYRTNLEQGKIFYGKNKNV